MLGPPGLIGDLAMWMDDCAVHAAPLLSLGAAISLAGVLCGRRYATTTGLRGNVYLVGVARSGVGKENARQCAMSMLTRSGLDGLRGTDEIASAAGLLKKMHEGPTRLFCLDELGRILASIGGRNAGTHERAIATTLMKLHGSAPGVFLGTAYAERSENPIEQPHCVVWGTTTPDSFYGALKASDVVDGFLNRLLVLEVDHGQHAPSVPRASRSEPPQELVERCKALGNGEFIPDRGNLSIVNASMSGVRYSPRVVSMTEQATAVLDAFSEGVRKQINSSKIAEVWARAREHAWRLALVQAVSEAPADPRIEADHMRWASRFVWWATMRVSVAVSERMGESDEQRCGAAIVRYLRTADRGMASIRDIARIAARGYDKRVRDQALRDLAERGYLEVRQIRESSRSTTYYELTEDDQ